jgi:hypothetical protein
MAAVASNDLRIFGREITVRLTRGANLIAQIAEFKEFTFETRQHIVTEGLLGETANRQDEIFDEVGGSFTLEHATAQVILLQQFISQRASTRAANQDQINITFRAQFPDATVARFTIPDCKFDPISFNVRGRDTYVESPISYKAKAYLLRLA